MSVRLFCVFVVKYDCVIFLIQRYFVLEKGILRYAKSHQDVSQLGVCLGFFLLLLFFFLKMYTINFPSCTHPADEREEPRRYGRQPRRDVRQQKVQTDRPGHGG